MEGRVDEVEPTSMPLVEDLPTTAMMDVEIVPDHIDRARRITLGHGLHERQQV
jgi:hypothetical protein